MQVENAVPANYLSAQLVTCAPHFAEAQQHAMHCWQSQAQLCQATVAWTATNLESGLDDHEVVLGGSQNPFAVIGDINSGDWSP